MTNGRQSIMISEMVGYCALLFYFILGSCPGLSIFTKKIYS
ncbi:hypothetical protein HMPREF9429_00941 [Megasphaera micronuciformis F0359]|uniref:Uncharacterized protein n=1 Tax=Megasphaera micronuciformis F0359 TaxID=706434 RepID=E2ZBV9_9FIRM|nr:hypothetical protein HMPREF9429_00941 [Megasphaera micronuciformis F0359]